MSKPKSRYNVGDNVSVSYEGDGVIVSKSYNKESRLRYYEVELHEPNVIEATELDLHDA